MPQYVGVAIMMPRLVPRLDPILFFRLALLAFVGSPAWAQASNSVGEATFVIGSPQVRSSEGDVRQLRKGDALKVGDQIETGNGSHVHLRFMDGGLVSVRPGSRLTVERYDYDAANPVASAIKFRLDGGVMRSISGKGAEAAKDRFRLNTPVAAIGVRGTDFVVLADRDSVRATVNSGAIVVSPFSDRCLPEGGGPCGGPVARELASATSNLMLELRRGQPEPQLVPKVGRSVPDVVQPPVRQELAPEGNSRNGQGTSPGASTNTELAVGGTQQRSDFIASIRPLVGNGAGSVVGGGDLPAAPLVPPPVTVAPPVVEPPPVVVTPPVVEPPPVVVTPPVVEPPPVVVTPPVVEPPPVVVTPPVVEPPPVVVRPPVVEPPPVVVTPPVVEEPPVVVTPPVVEQPPVVVTPPVVEQPPVVVVPPVVEPPPVTTGALVWGRWNRVRPGDNVTLDYASAKDGRTVTVGNMYAGLFRANTGATVLDPNLGQVNFRLASSTASYVASNNAVTPAQVDSGWLKMDFGARSFATGLSVSSAPTGTVGISGNGIIRPDGTFVGAQGGTQIAGASTLDGTEAAYLFKQTVGNGRLEGLTNWGR